MRPNPFDRTLSPQARERVERVKSFHEAQAQVQQCIRSCEQSRKAHKEAWEAHKREHHARRLEIAQEREDSHARYVPALERERQEQEDDRDFSHIKHQDQLLELRSHDDYLRGHRALERRRKVREVEMTVTVAPPPPQGLEKVRGIQVWAVLVGLFLGFVFLYSLSAGPAAVFGLPVYIGLWALAVRIPMWAGGAFMGGHRNSGGTSV